MLVENTTGVLGSAVQAVPSNAPKLTFDCSLLEIHTIGYFVTLAARELGLVAEEVGDSCVFPSPLSNTCTVSRIPKASKQPEVERLFRAVLNLMENSKLPASLLPKTIKESRFQHVVASLCSQVIQEEVNQ